METATTIPPPSNGEIVDDGNNLPIPSSRIARTREETVSLQDTLTLGDVLAKSGFFGDARTASQAVVKILAGREMGFSPMASMTGVFIVEGKPTLGAHLLAAAIKRSEKYDYELRVANRETCTVEFFECDGAGKSIRKGRPGWKSLGSLSMTIQEATESELTVSNQGKEKRNWRVHPDDMLFARVISKGYRRHCPDLVGGILAYTPDELETGNVSGSFPQPEQPEQETNTPPPPEPDPQPELETPKTVEMHQLKRIYRLLHLLKMSVPEALEKVQRKYPNLKEFDQMTEEQANEIELALTNKYEGRS